MTDVRITRTEDFLRAARALNEAGSQGRGLWRELNSAISTSAEPMVAAVKVHLDAYLPNTYAAELRHDLVVKPSRSTRGASAGLRLVGHAKGKRKRRHVREIDHGVLRHPVYGNRGTWVDQRVRPGFWSEPLLAASGKPAQEIHRAIEQTLSRIARGV